MSWGGGRGEGRGGKAETKRSREPLEAAHQREGPKGRSAPRLQASGNGFCPHLPLHDPPGPPGPPVPCSLTLPPNPAGKQPFHPGACWALCPVRVGFAHTAQQTACGGVRVPQRVQRGSAWEHQGSEFYVFDFHAYPAGRAPFPHDVEGMAIPWAGYGTQPHSPDFQALLALPLTCHVIFKASHFSTPYSRLLVCTMGSPLGIVVGVSDIVRWGCEPRT